MTGNQNDQLDIRVLSEIAQQNGLRGVVADVWDIILDYSGGNVPTLAGAKKLQQKIKNGNGLLSEQAGQLLDAYLSKATHSETPRPVKSTKPKPRRQLPKSEPEPPRPKRRARTVQKQAYGKPIDSDRLYDICRQHQLPERTVEKLLTAIRPNGIATEPLLAACYVEWTRDIYSCEQSANVINLAAAYLNKPIPKPVKQKTKYEPRSPRTKPNYSATTVAPTNEPTKEQPPHAEKPDSPIEHSRLYAKLDGLNEDVDPTMFAVSNVPVNQSTAEIARTTLDVLIREGVLPNNIERGVRGAVNYTHSSAQHGTIELAVTKKGINLTVNDRQFGINLTVEAFAERLHDYLSPD